MILVQIQGSSAFSAILEAFFWALRAPTSGHRAWRCGSVGVEARGGFSMRGMRRTASCKCGWQKAGYEAGCKILSKVCLGKEKSTVMAGDDYDVRRATFAPALKEQSCALALIVQEHAFRLTRRIAGSSLAPSR